jgi:hypothetical protein
MNTQRRYEICNRLVFQNPVQKFDLLNPAKTTDALLGGLYQLVITEGRHIEITAVRSDHHDDSCLGPLAHACGHAIDFWPLNSNKPGDYIDGSCELFSTFLNALTHLPHVRQIGLAGSAFTAENLLILGPLGFVDGGADHIHFGAS